MLDSERKRARYLGPDVRRPLVLDAAGKLIADVGYHAASMQHLADGLRISKAVLYDCFPGGKRHLLAEVLARAEQRFHDDVVGAAIAGASREDVVSGGVHRFLALAGDDAILIRTLLGRIGSRDPHVAAMTDNARSRIVRAFALLLARDDDVAPLAEVCMLALATLADDLARDRDAGTAARADVVRAVVALIIQSADEARPATAS
ncbi:MAG TPA: helix-turn-helix domain-containing protein [Actinomycetota bacterium]